MRSMLVHISNPFHERQNLNLCCVVLLLYVNIHVFQQGCTRLCETPFFGSGPAVKDQDGEPALTLPEARRMINAQLGMHHCIIIN